MKLKKIFLLSIALLTLFGSSVFAGSQTIQLYTNQTSVYSASIEAVKAKAANVYNYSYSERSVYCDLWRYDFYGGTEKIVTHLVDPTETYNSGWYNYVPPGYNRFQLYLNPQGLLTDGCRAYGTLEYVN